MNEISSTREREGVWIHIPEVSQAVMAEKIKPSDSFGFAVDKDKYYHGSLHCCLARFPRDITLRDSLNQHLPVIVSSRFHHYYLRLLISQGLSLEILEFVLILRNNLTHVLFYIVRNSNTGPSEDQCRNR